MSWRDSETGTSASCFSFIICCRSSRPPKTWRCRFANQLSGGEQQRVAIARALLTDPILFLADEPTGNLDLETSERVFELMRECHVKRGLTSVVVTHNPDLAARCDRIYEMK